MLIIEGPDLAGKTTLARKLVEGLNAYGKSHIYQKLDKLPDSFDVVYGYTQLISPHTVWDRFHLSRQAYGYAGVTQAQPSIQETNMLEGALSLAGCVTIVLGFWDLDLLETRYKQRKEPYSLDQIKKANEWYIRQELSNFTMAAIKDETDLRAKCIEITEYYFEHTREYHRIIARKILA